MIEDIDKILADERDIPEEELPEDLAILQPDRSRACVNWELRGKGYSLVNQDETEKRLSDEELLKDAYKQVGISYKGKKIREKK
jgi:hypothetical protein